MSPRTHSTSRTQNSPDSSKSKSSAKPSSSSVSVALLSSKQLWTMCLLPLWLVAIIVFDHAAADFHDQAFFASVRADLAELNRVQEPEKIDDTLRTYWVSTDNEGNLSGRISAIDAELSGVSPLAQLEIVLLQNGQVKRKTDATDENGQFTLQDVEPGNYSLVASGPNGFLAYSIHVLTPFAQSDPDQTGSLPLPPATPQFVSFSKTNPLPVEGQEKFQVDAAAIPPTFLELERIVSGYLPSDVELALGQNVENGQPLDLLKISSGFKFALNADGSFSGRVLPPVGEEERVELSDMNIFLLQDDIEMHRVDVEKNGDFKIEGVEPGVYAVVAAGKEGFAALSFELVSSDNALGLSEGEQQEHYVSLTAPKPEPSFNISIIVDPEDIKYCRNRIKELVGQDGMMVEQDPGAYLDDGIQYLQPNSGGYAPANGGSPGTVGQSATAGRGPLGSGGSGTFLRRALLGAAIALPLALGGEEPAPMTPSQTN